MADYIYYSNDNGIFRAKVERDDYVENPREWCDHEGTHMHIWWRGHEYHDDGNNMDVDELLELIIFAESDLDEDRVYEMTTTEKINYLRDNHDYVFILINGYEHSGFTISTGSGYPYSCPWDGGSAGFIYTSKKEAVEKIGYTEDDWKEQAITLLKAEVKEYDQWLVGDVYYVDIERLVDEDWEQWESCGGIYSDEYGDDLIRYCASEILCFDEYDEVSEKWVEAVITQREEENIKKEEIAEKNRLALLERFDDKVRKIYDKYRIKAEDLQELAVIEGR